MRPAPFSPTARETSRLESSIRSAVLIVAFALGAALSGSLAAYAGERNWVGTWMASPQPVWKPDFALPTKVPQSVKDQTIRQVVRVSLGGDRVRLVFSNAYGDQPLKIGAASVGLVGENGAVEPATIHKVTFGGKDGILVPPGAPAMSDPLELIVETRAKLAVSIYLPDETPLATFHWDGRQTAWFGNGDLTRAGDFTATATTDARMFLSEVRVETRNDGAVAVVGDSITDGNGATVDADTRWSDFLAQRLAPDHVAVLNAGISGALARANNVRLVGATLPPFEGALSGTPLGDYYNPDKDALRQEVNRWIRESGAFDAIVDFDAVLRDPDQPGRLIPAFDSGDHLHPGDKGNRAMADAIDVGVLLGR